MINCQKSSFNLENGVTYLNCGYMSPMHKEVEEAGIRGIQMKRNPHKVTPDDFFSDVISLKDKFAKLINVPDPSRIAIIPSVSYGLANVANNIKLKDGEKVLVLEGQFPSNYYPWVEIREGCSHMQTISQQKSGREWNESVLNAITDEVRLIALPHVHWANGTILDLKRIREKADQHNALLVIDGTQSVGALPFDASEIRPDALICAGYKCMMGPYSIGLAYYGEAFDEGLPIENNWISRLNSENFRELVNYQESYQPGAHRYSVGEHSNFILVPMMLKALELITDWGVDNIQEYCKSITRSGITELEKIGYKLQEEQYRAAHLFGIDIPEGIDPEVLKEYFIREKISVSFRGESIRVSPNVYNDEADIDHLVNSMSSLL